MGTVKRQTSKRKFGYRTVWKVNPVRIYQLGCKFAFWLRTSQKKCWVRPGPGKPSQKDHFHGSLDETKQTSHPSWKSTAFSWSPNHPWWTTDGILHTKLKKKKKFFPSLGFSRNFFFFYISRTFCKYDLSLLDNCLDHFLSLRSWERYTKCWKGAWLGLSFVGWL